MRTELCCLMCYRKAALLATTLRKRLCARNPCPSQPPSTAPGVGPQPRGLCTAAIWGQLWVILQHAEHLVEPLASVHWVPGAPTPPTTLTNSRYSEMSLGRKQITSFCSRLFWKEAGRNPKKQIQEWGTNHTGSKKKSPGSSQRERETGQDRCSNMLLGMCAICPPTIV